MMLASEPQSSSIHSVVRTNQQTPLVLHLAGILGIFQNWGCGIGVISIRQVELINPLNIQKPAGINRNSYNIHVSKHRNANCVKE